MHAIILRTLIIMTLLKFTENVQKNLLIFGNRYYVTSKGSFKIEKKIVWFFIKITVTDQIKFIDNKIKANQAQYDLDRLTAKISGLPSGELRKYEYLTGEDLGYRPTWTNKNWLFSLG